MSDETHTKWSFHFAEDAATTTLSELLAAERIRNRIATIEAVLDKASEELHLLKSELLGVSIAGISTSCKHDLDKGTLSALERRVTTHQRQRLFTEGGSTKGIRDKIKQVLASRNEPMTSAQLAEAIYVPDPRVSFDLFKRRVIVAVSSMHKDESPPQVVPSNHKGHGREIYWTLPKKALLEPKTITQNEPGIAS